jgi:hypothetical protein
MRLIIARKLLKEWIWICLFIFDISDLELLIWFMFDKSLSIYWWVTKVDPNIYSSLFLEYPCIIHWHIMCALPNNKKMEANVNTNNHLSLLAYL